MIRKLSIASLNLLITLLILFVAVPVLAQGDTVTTSVVDWDKVIMGALLAAVIVISWRTGDLIPRSYVDKLFDVVDEVTRRIPGTIDDTIAKLARDAVIDELERRGKLEPTRTTDVNAHNAPTNRIPPPIPENAGDPLTPKKP